MLRLGKPNKKKISTNTRPGFPGFRIIGQKGPIYAGFRFLVSYGLTETGWNLAWKNFSKVPLTKKPIKLSMIVVLVF